MLCEKCKNKPIVRGIKQIKCLDCYKEVMMSYVYDAHICDNCSDRTHNCVSCGALCNQNFDCNINDVTELKKYLLDYCEIADGRNNLLIENQKLKEENDRLIKEVTQLAIESVNRAKTLTELECEVEYLKNRKTPCSKCEFEDMIKCCHNDYCGETYKYFKPRRNGKNA